MMAKKSAESLWRHAGEFRRVGLCDLSLAKVFVHPRKDILHTRIQLFAVFPNEVRRIEWAPAAQSAQPLEKLEQVGHREFFLILQLAQQRTALVDSRSSQDQASRRLGEKPGYSMILWQLPKGFTPGPWQKVHYRPRRPLSLIGVRTESMREIAADQIKFSISIGRNRPPDMANAAALVDLNELPFRVKVPVKVHALFSEGAHRKSPRLGGRKGFSFGSAEGVWSAFYGVNCVPV